MEKRRETPVIGSHMVGQKGVNFREEEWRKYSLEQAMAGIQKKEKEKKKHVFPCQKSRGLSQLHGSGSESQFSGNQKYIISLKG